MHLDASPAWWMYTGNESDRINVHGEALLYFAGICGSFHQLMPDNWTTVLKIITSRACSCPVMCLFISGLCFALLCIISRATSGPFTWAPDRIPFAKPKCEQFISFSGIYFIRLLSQSGRNFTVSGRDLPCDVSQFLSPKVQHPETRADFSSCCIRILSSTFSAVGSSMNP